MILIASTPIKNASIKSLLSGDTSPALKRIYPITRFKFAHNILTNGEESPLPGGLENGVGKRFPEIPFIKCGIAFARKTPAKNAAM